MAEKDYILQVKDLQKYYPIKTALGNIKGYNKAVTLSVYVKQKNELKLTKLKNEIRNTIKDTVREITDKIREENFSCYKAKRK